MSNHGKQVANRFIHKMDAQINNINDERRNIASRNGNCDETQYSRSKNKGITQS